MYLYKSEGDKLKDILDIVNICKYIYIEHLNVHGYPPTNYGYSSIIHLFIMYSIFELGELPQSFFILTKRESRIKYRRLGTLEIDIALITDRHGDSELCNYFKLDYSTDFRSHPSKHYRESVYTPLDLDNHSVAMYTKPHIMILDRIIDLYKSAEIMFEYRTDRIASNTIVPYPIYINRFRMGMKLFRVKGHIIDQKIKDKYDMQLYYNVKAPKGKTFILKYGEIHKFIDGK